MNPQQFVLAGTRGGQLRVRILEALDGTPRTAEELSATLEADAETLREHLVVLEANGLVVVPDRTDAAGYVPAEGVTAGAEE